MTSCTRDSLQSGGGEWPYIGAWRACTVIGNAESIGTEEGRLIEVVRETSKVLFISIFWVRQQVHQERVRKGIKCDGCEERGGNVESSPHKGGANGDFGAL